MTAPVSDVSAIVPLPISAADKLADVRTAAFLPLHGAAALPRVVRALLGAIDEPGRVVVATAAALADDVRTSLADHDLSAVTVISVDGTPDRGECVAAALTHLDDARQTTSYVLLHDISQPLTSAAVCGCVIDGLRGGAAVVMPALALTDSVKVVDVHGSVTGTVDRSALRAVQYPRGFVVDLLAQLISGSVSRAFDELESAAPIMFVDGDPDGFRVELPRDAQFVEAVIASRR